MTGADRVRRRPLGMPVPFWVALIPGGSLMAIGAHGLLVSQGRHIVSPLKLIVGLSLVSDLVVVPIAIFVAFAVVRLVPAWLARPLQGGLVVSAIVSLFALPAVHRWGAQAASSTVLPRDYLSGFLELLVAIGVATAIAVLLARVRRGRRHP